MLSALAPILDTSKGLRNKEMGAKRSVIIKHRVYTSFSCLHVPFVASMTHPSEKIPLEKVTQLLHGSTVIMLKEEGKKNRAAGQACGLKLSLSCIFVSKSQDALRFPQEAQNRNTLKCFLLLFL